MSRDKVRSSVFDLSVLAFNFVTLELHSADERADVPRLLLLARFKCHDACECSSNMQKIYRTRWSVSVSGIDNRARTFESINFD